MAAFLCLLVAALLSPRPLVAGTSPPDAAAVGAASEAAAQLFAVLRAEGEPRTVVLTQDQLRSIARLAHHGTGRIEADAAIGEARLVVLASVRVASGAWSNIVVRADDTGAVPRIRVRVGHLPVPVEGLLAVGSLLVRLQGGDGLPPLEKLVPRLQLEPGRLTAEVSLPPALLAVDDMLRDQAGRIDPALVRTIHAQLLAHQRRDPDAALVAQLRRAMTLARGHGSTGCRAALVALAMLVSGPEVGRIADVEPETVGALPGEPPVFLLAGRHDLAQHLALSAALAARFDLRLTTAIGEWKELRDSLPGGSGFSFVDLAADRAGTLLGLGLSDRKLWQAVARQLESIEARELFPAAALRLDEGLSDGVFEARYGGIRSPSFRAAASRIDARLRALRLYRPLLEKWQSPSTWLTELRPAPGGEGVDEPKLR